MESLFWALVVLVVVVPAVSMVTSVMAWLRLKSLEGSVARLGQEVAMLRRWDGAAAEDDPAAGAVAVAPTPPAALPLPGAAPVPGPAAREDEGAAPAALAPPPPGRSGILDRLGAHGGGFEERLGVGGAVWLGAIAVALAVVFLVRYSFAQGWISPSVRITAGILLGAALLGAAERIDKEASRVAAGVAAAGIATMLTSFLAAANAYGLLPPAVAFLLMGLTAVVGVGLGLRHGRIVAAVGLAGGFLTPALLSTGGEARAAPLFAYLLVIQAAVLAVSRLRGWNVLPAAGTAAGGLWVMFWISARGVPAGGSTLALYVLAATGLTVVAVMEPRGQDRWGKAAGALAWLAMGTGILTMSLVVGAAGYGTVEWAFLGVLGTAGLVLGRLDDRYRGMAPLAAVATGAMLLAWARRGVEADLPSLYATTAALGGLYALGAFANVWAGRRAAMWAALASLASVGAFGIAFAARGAARATPQGWGLAALVVAALLVAMAAALARRRSEVEGGELALAALAAGATAFVSLAVPLELAPRWLAVAWAVEVAAVIWIAGRLDVPSLRPVAWPVATLVVLRLVVPVGLLSAVGPGVLANWLPYGYGLPIAAFGLGAVWSWRQGDEILAAALTYAASLLAVVYLLLGVRQFYHPGEILSSRWTLVEAATLVTAWLVLGGVLAWQGSLRGARAVERASLGISSLALATEVIGPVLFLNPAWTHRPVGQSLIANRLLVGYGVPALAALVMAVGLRRRGTADGALASARAVLSTAAMVLGALLLFLLLNLEIRQAFRGTYLDTGPWTTAENYAYSLAWVVFALALLGIGIVRRWSSARKASLAVMLLAVGKVFLLDTASLTGLYRVFSFLGLGFSLLALAYVYQRLVFKEESR